MRPKKSYIQVLLDHGEKDMLRELATAERRDMSSMVRELIHREYSQRLFGSRRAKPGIE